MNKNQFDDMFDDILDMNDPDFAEKFKVALGVKPGDVVEIVTPQFERTDGITPVTSIDSWDALRRMDQSALKTLGCGAWDEPDANGTVLMLFPSEWYDAIPEGYVCEDINGEEELFKTGVTDDDMRFGCLPYGIRVNARTEGK